VAQDTWLVETEGATCTSLQRRQTYQPSFFSKDMGNMSVAPIFFNKKNKGLVIMVVARKLERGENLF